MGTENRAEIEAARRKNKDKRIDRRLQALLMRAEGAKIEDIVKTVGYSRAHINNLIRLYFEEGIDAITENHYPGNRRNMSFEEETEFLEQFRKKAEAGQIVDVREIEAAYREKVGHRIGGGQIYCVLRRHGWRKVMPRSKHPNKANEEVIETSKKLKQKSTN